MRIDLNPSSMPELARSSGSDNSAKAGQSTAAGQTSANAGDVAQLSTGADAVQTLKSHLDQLPDVRQDRVDTLRQAISDGSFKASPDQIASAMLANPNQAPGK
jgi:negative regulator of flagellin synthesis FlgM